MPEALLVEKRQTWKEYSGRVDGPDGWQFGDVWRRTCDKISGGMSAEEKAELSKTVANKAEVNQEDVSMLDLKTQRDQLVGQRKRVDKMVAKDTETVKVLMEKGDKTRAMMALKKRKLHEQMVLDCENHVTNLDSLIMNIEVAQQQKEIVEALAEGVKTLKRVKEEIGGADYVEKLMDETADLTDELQEINQLLAGNGVAIDDDEVLAELEKLQEAAALEVLTQKVTPENAPNEHAAVQQPAAQAAAAAPAAPAAAAPVEEEAPKRELIAA